MSIEPRAKGKKVTVVRTLILILTLTPTPTLTPTLTLPLTLTLTKVTVVHNVTGDLDQMCKDLKGAVGSGGMKDDPNPNPNPNPNLNPDPDPNPNPNSNPNPNQAPRRRRLLEACLSRLEAEAPGRTTTPMAGAAREARLQLQP